MKRVVVTGMAGVTAFGQDWPSVRARLQAGRNAVVNMPEWAIYDGLNTRLAAPIPDFTLPAHYPRKKTRAMGRVSQLATVATELALAQAGLLDNPALTDGRTGIAYGSSTGSTDPIRAFGVMLNDKSTASITATWATAVPSAPSRTVNPSTPPWA